MFANGYKEGLKESFSEKSIVRQELLDDFDLELESFWIDDDMMIFTTSEGKKYVIHNPLDLDEAELAYAVYDAVESELDESLNEEFHRAAIRVKLDTNNSSFKRDIDKLNNLCMSHHIKGRLAFSDTYVIVIEDEDNVQCLRQKAKDVMWYIDRNIDSLIGYHNDSLLKEDFTDESLNESLPKSFMKELKE